MQSKKPLSVQAHQNIEPIIGGMPSPIRFFSDMDIPPGQCSVDRDNWLRTFWKQIGADMLQSVLAVAVAKVATQNYEIEGPKKLVEFYHRQFGTEADFGKGYSYMIQRGVIDYYTQNNGWFIERLRGSKSDKRGPCLGISHLDSGRMRPTSNAETPYTYFDIHGEYHLMHTSQFIRLVDMPDPETTIHGDERGFCALSRSIATALILVQLYALKREKLADLPPSAMAIFNNITKKQFEQTQILYGLKQESKGNSIFRDVMPLFGIDPAHPASLDFVSFREVWESFDDMTAMNLAAYSFAAGFRMDPREFWPVSQGPLGTGKEAEVQHQKAKSKSTGLIFTELERAFNSLDTLPPDISFRFQLQDADEEQQRAEIHSLQIANVKSMQDAGAELSPEEIRYLLVQGKILPRSLEKPLGEGETLQLEDAFVYRDDVDRGAKSFGGFDFGPDIIIDNHGSILYEYGTKGGPSSGFRGHGDRIGKIGDEIGEKARYEVPATIPRRVPGHGQPGFVGYGESIRGAVRGYWGEQTDYFTFYDHMDAAVRNGLRRGFEEGMKAGGVQEPLVLSGDALIKLRDLIANELRHVDRFASHIEVNRKSEGGKLTPLLQRSDMWSLTYLEAVNWGKLYGKDMQRYVWRYGATKAHCSDALNLNGRVYTAKTWRKFGAVPQSRDLECGGWKCGCGLFQTDDPVTPGRPPKLMGQKELPLVWWLDFDNLLEGEVHA